MRLIIYAMILLWSLNNLAEGQTGENPSDSLQSPELSALEKAKKEYKAKTDSLIAAERERYISQLEACIRRLAEKGDLAGARFIQDEIESQLDPESRSTDSGECDAAVKVRGLREELEAEIAEKTRNEREKFNAQVEEQLKKYGKAGDLASAEAAELMLNGQPVEKPPKELVRLSEAFYAKTSALRSAENAKILPKFEQLKREYAAKGDLPSALLCQAEIDMIKPRKADAEPAPPKELEALRRQYEQKVKGLVGPELRKYIAVLDQLKRKAGGEGRLEEAKFIQQEIDSCSVIRSSMRAKLYVTCDNSYTVWLNGKEIGKGNDWNRLDEFKISLRQGDRLAIEAQDLDNGSHSAGLLCCIILDGGGKAWATGEDWNCTAEDPGKGWQNGSRKLKGEAKCSTENIHSTHKAGSSRYKDVKGIRGNFIWSEKPARTIWIRETIDLGKFK